MVANAKPLRMIRFMNFMEIQHAMEMGGGCMSIFAVNTEPFSQKETVPQIIFELENPIGGDT